MQKKTSRPPALLPPSNSVPSSEDTLANTASDNKSSLPNEPLPDPIDGKHYTPPEIASILANVSNASKRRLIVADLILKSFIPVKDPDTVFKMLRRPKNLERRCRNTGI
jgi:hypothetical protein